MVKKERINFATGQKQPIRRAKIRDSPMTMSNFMSLGCLTEIFYFRDKYIRLVEVVSACYLNL